MEVKNTLDGVGLLRGTAWAKPEKMAQRTARGPAGLETLFPKLQNLSSTFMTFDRFAHHLKHYLHNVCLQMDFLFNLNVF